MNVGSSPECAVERAAPRHGYSHCRMWSSFRGPLSSSVFADCWTVPSKVDLYQNIYCCVERYSILFGTSRKVPMDHLFKFSQEYQSPDNVSLKNRISSDIKFCFNWHFLASHGGAMCSTSSICCLQGVKEILVESVEASHTTWLVKQFGLILFMHGMHGICLPLATFSPYSFGT